MPTLDTKSGKAAPVGPSVGFLGAPYRLFWERLDPACVMGQPPLLMLPGGAHTGACYRVTPDGRPGWADRFRDFGYTVYTTDWPGQGRCGFIRPEDITYEFVANAMAALVRAIGDSRLIVFTHSMTGPVGWKLLEIAGDSLAAVVAVGPGPPGNIQPIPCRADEDPVQARVAGEVIAERDDFAHIRFRGNDFVMDFSQPSADIGDYLKKIAIGDSTRFPESARAAWEASLTYVPPRLMAQRLNWRGRALAVGAEADFSGKRVLIVTGSRDAAHTRQDDGGTAAFLAKRGAQVDFLWLGDAGIWGNGHMLMLEDNSDEIADLIAERIDRMRAPLSTGSDPIVMRP